MKALLVISPVALSAAPGVSSLVIFCSHHPCLVGTAKKDAIWKVFFILQFTCSGISLLSNNFVVFFYLHKPNLNFIKVYVLIILIGCRGGLSTSQGLYNSEEGFVFLGGCKYVCSVFEL